MSPTIITMPASRIENSVQADQIKGSHKDKDMAEQSTTISLSICKEDKSNMNYALGLTLPTQSSLEFILKSTNIGGKM